MNGSIGNCSDREGEGAMISYLVQRTISVVCFGFSRVSNPIRKVWACAVSLSIGAAVLSVTSAYAQSDDLGATGTGVAAPHYRLTTTDENGVDAISGAVRFQVGLISIGPAEQGISYSVVIPSLAHAGTQGTRLFSGLERIFRFSNFSGGVSVNGGINDYPETCENYFELAGSRTYFCGGLSTSFVPKEPGGETLVYDGSQFIFTDSSGVRYLSKGGLAQRTTNSDVFGLQSIEYPNGNKVSIYRFEHATTIENSFGYAIRITSPDGGDTHNLVAYNKAHEACSAADLQCSLSSDWPSAQIFVGDPETAVPAYIEDMSSLRTVFYARARTGAGYDGYHYYRVKPAGVEDTITYEFCGPWHVSCAIYCSSNASPSNECLTARMSEWKVRRVLKGDAVWEYDYDYTVE